MGIFNIFKNKKSKFAVGQEWHYHTRKGEEDSTLIIVKIEPEQDDFIVHIAVEKIYLQHKNTVQGFATRLAHLPISHESLQKSITKIKDDRCPMPDYEFGYVHWKNAYDENRAGVFDLPLNQILDYLDEAIQ